MKGRGSNAFAAKIMTESLMCRWFGITKKQLRKLPYQERIQHEIVFSTILEIKPEMLMGM